MGPGHAIKCMVFDPGQTGFEGNNPGILYTGISRATTLGNGCVKNDSAFYLAGPYATKDRLTNLTQMRAKGRKKVTYLTVLRRQRWLDFLSVSELRTRSLPTAEHSELKRWLVTSTETKILLPTSFIFDFFIHINTYDSSREKFSTRYILPGD